MVLVHSQKSYLDQTIISNHVHVDTIRFASSHLDSATTDSGTTVDSKRAISSFSSGKSATYVIEIGVHETRKTDSESRPIPTRSFRRLSEEGEIEGAFQSSV